ncbi:hypothetical protein HPHPH10_1188 [Helicobacter pylori Hp H-10]|nr:hypothetical protein HPHPH10_1188 [Helicobacter pylori Hp H-10]
MGYSLIPFCLLKYHLLKTQICSFSHFLNLLKTLFIVLIEQSIFKTWIKSIENLKT